MLTDDVIERYENELDEDEPIEDTFRRLRRDGHSRLEAVRVILAVLDVSLSEAKRVLITNDTWAEARSEMPPSDDPPETNAPPPAPG